MWFILCYCRRWEKQRVIDYTNYTLRFLLLILRINNYITKIILQRIAIVGQLVRAMLCFIMWASHSLTKIKDLQVVKRSGCIQRRLLKESCYAQVDYTPTFFGYIPTICVHLNPLCTPQTSLMQYRVPESSQINHTLTNIRNILLIQNHMLSAAIVVFLTIFLLYYDRPNPAAYHERRQDNLVSAWVQYF